MERSNQPEIRFKLKRNHSRSQVERSRAEMQRANAEMKKAEGDSQMASLIGISLTIAAIAAGACIIGSMFIG